MVYKIIISAHAEADTKEAYLFYEEIQPDLGECFLYELTKWYRKLEVHPLHYSFISEQKIIRAVSLKTFPFQIIYQVEGTQIYVFAVHHFSKRLRTDLL